MEPPKSIEYRKMWRMKPKCQILRRRKKGETNQERFNGEEGVSVIMLNPFKNSK